MHKKWIIAIRRDEGKDFQVTKFTKVCSKHFCDCDFVPAVASGHSLLRETAVPSVFAFTKRRSTRKPPKHRARPPCSAKAQDQIERSDQTLQTQESGAWSDGTKNYVDVNASASFDTDAGRPAEETSSDTLSAQKVKCQGSGACSDSTENYVDVNASASFDTAAGTPAEETSSDTSSAHKNALRSPTTTSCCTLGCQDTDASRSRSIFWIRGRNGPVSPVQRVILQDRVAKESSALKMNSSWCW
ncbi:peroxynitrite isomerase THAP4-like isoform X2 [Ornithodoros turicata]